MTDKQVLDISVLYVEDDNETREGVAESLRFRVRELETAKDGKEGLEKFKKKQPQVVITDIKMPTMTGLEMSKEIKKISKTTPIIITTAYNDTDLLIECIDIGVNQFVLKPIVINKLMESVSKCVEIINK